MNGRWNTVIGGLLTLVIAMLGYLVMQQSTATDARISLGRDLSNITQRIVAIETLLQERSGKMPTETKEILDKLERRVLRLERSLPPRHDGG